MTEQIKETVIYNNKEYQTYSYPELPTFLSLKVIFDRTYTHTACYRNYVGIWEIVDEKLFLKELSGKKMKKAKFAKWFSGEILIPGNLKTEPEKFYYAAYDGDDLERPSQYTYFHFKNGKLIETEIRKKIDTPFHGKVSMTYFFSNFSDAKAVRETTLFQKVKNLFHLN